MSEIDPNYQHLIYQMLLQPEFSHIWNGEDPSHEGLARALYEMTDAADTLRFSTQASQIVQDNSAQVTQEGFDQTLQALRSQGAIDSSFHQARLTFSYNSDTRMMSANGQGPNGVLIHDEFHARDLVTALDGMGFSLEHAFHIEDQVKGMVMNGQADFQLYEGALVETQPQKTRMTFEFDSESRSVTFQGTGPNGVLLEAQTVAAGELSFELETIGFDVEEAIRIQREMGDHVRDGVSKMLFEGGQLTEYHDDHSAVEVERTHAAWDATQPYTVHGSIEIGEGPVVSALFQEADEIETAMRDGSDIPAQEQTLKNDLVLNQAPNVVA